MDAGNLFGIGLGVVMVGGFGTLIYYADSKSNIRQEYDDALIRTTVKYADFNNDGLISKEEKDTFYRDLLRNKGARLVEGEEVPRDISTGEKIYRETMTQWLKDYVPSKEFLNDPLSNSPGGN